MAIKNNKSIKQLKASYLPSLLQISDFFLRLDMLQSLFLFVSTCTSLGRGRFLPVFFSFRDLVALQSCARFLSDVVD